MKYQNIEINKNTDLDRKIVQFAVKRLMDIVISLISIIILSPIFLIIFILIKVDSKGPVIFKQIRVGKNNKNFKIYKFRTMIVNSDKNRDLQLNVENIENFIFQSKRDSRITKVGDALRKSSLDELPQLFNVFIGNMSIVGPRPEIPEVVKYYPENYKQRLLVKPGITGLAQVSGRGEIELGKTVNFDLTYIKKFSLFYDIKLIISTVGSVLKKDGAF
jgi:lipopolysaccharide/colanic/teichoic acid biosynthesis glycosyltransferase